MLSEYQLKITDLYSIPTGNLKNQILTFLIKKSASLGKFETLLENRIKTKTCIAQWDLINHNG